jgi:hypothetical protein
MKFWYFRFEARFLAGHEEKGKGISSGCVVPNSNKQESENALVEALRQNGAELISILEAFAYIGNELDPSDERNKLWIRWYKKADSK